MTLPVAILAGGLATRLRPVSTTIPKVLIEVAGAPFAIHQLNLLQRQGYSDIVYCLGHLGEQVEAALGDGQAHGMRLRYSYDGDKLIGTGGAILRALPLLGEAFLTLYGDSYLDCDYGAAEQAFRDSGKLALMTVYPNAGRWDTSNVVFRDGQIVRYDKAGRTPDMGHIDYGLGFFHAAAFDGYPEGEPLDLATVYQDLLARGVLAGHLVEQRFYEIGSVAGLEETRRYLAHVKGSQ